MKIDHELAAELNNICRVILAKNESHHFLSSFDRCHLQVAIIRYFQDRNLMSISVPDSTIDAIERLARAHYSSTAN